MNVANSLLKNSTHAKRILYKLSPKLKNVLCVEEEVTGAFFEEEDIGNTSLKIEKENK